MLACLLRAWTMHGIGVKILHAFTHDADTTILNQEGHVAG